MKRNSQSGQALAFVAVGLVVLLGFVGLGIDMGMLRFQKRLGQTAADAAAIAGATNLTLGGVQAAAQNAATANGFADSSGNDATQCSNSAAIGTTCVQINNGPADVTVNGVTIPAGPHAGNAAYVEAVVSMVHPTYFMNIFGVDRQTVTARAVATSYSGATNGSTNFNCVITLGPPQDAIEGVNINGSAVLNAPTCGISDNGNYNTQGNKLIVSAGSFGVSGGENVAGQGGSVTCTSGQTSCPEYGVPATPDPLANLTPPCSPCTVGTSISISGTTISGSGAANVSYNSATNTFTIQPGNYSGINLQGAPNGSTVNFASGTYIIDGTTGCNDSCISIPGNLTVMGTGVFFYFTNTATFQTNGTPHIVLSAPTTGTYADILMYQDPNDTNAGPNPNGPTIGGDNTSSYSGVLYFPADQVTFYGNTTTSGNGIAIGAVISRSLAMSGNPTLNLLGKAGMPGGSVPPALTLGSATLVE